MSKEQTNEKHQEISPEEREKIVAWYKDQIELAELRAKLTRLHSEITQDEARRIQASAIIAQFQNGQVNESQAGEQTSTES